MPCQQSRTGAARSIIHPYEAARTAELTRSSVAFVYKKVLADSLNAQPCVGERADSTGPTMENVPIQYSRQPVTRPAPLPSSPRGGRLSAAELPSSSGEGLGEGAGLSLPTRLSLVPTSPPTARLRIKSTGNSLFAILGSAAFMPSTRQQSPKPSKRAFLYFSPMPERTKAPKALPTTMAQVLTIVPNNLFDLTI